MERGAGGARCVSTNVVGIFQAQAFASRNAIAASARQARDVVTYIIEHHAHSAAGILRVGYNGVEWLIGILYEGSETRHLPASRFAVLPREMALENEEAAKVQGIGDFLRGVVADYKNVSVRNAKVFVRLFYALCRAQSVSAESVDTG